MILLPEEILKQKDAISQSEPFLHIFEIALTPEVPEQEFIPKTYKLGDTVFYGVKVYKVVVASTTEIPGTGTDWQDLTEFSTYRFVDNTEEIVYEGNTYFPRKCSLGGLTVNGDGELPEVSLTIDNIDRLLMNVLRTFKGGSGSRIRSTVVYTGLLNLDFSNLSNILTVISTDYSTSDIVLNLGIKSPLNQRCPLYKYGTYCKWGYKREECGYTGPLGPCNHTYAHCKEREKTTNFGGEIGLRADVIRLV